MCIYKPFRKCAYISHLERRRFHMLLPFVSYVATICLFIFVCNYLLFIRVFRVLNSRFVVTAIKYVAVVVMLSYCQFLDTISKEKVINQKIEKLQKGIRFFEEYLSLKIKRGSDG